MKNYLYLVIGSILFGGIGIFVKLIGDSMHFMSLNFYRVIFAFLTLLLICPFIDKSTFKVTKKDMLLYAIVGLIISISLSLSNIAYLYAPVQNVAFITSMNIFFVLFFAFFLLGERVTRTKIITIIIAIVGLAILNPIRSEGMLGNILALIVAGIDGLQTVFMRKADKSRSIGDVMWFFFFATLFLLPTGFIFGFGGISLNVILLGVLATGLAYLFYNLAMEKIEAEFSAIIVNLVYPISAILLAVIILMEPLNFRVIIGGIILILSGVYLQFHLMKGTQTFKRSL